MKLSALAFAFAAVFATGSAQAAGDAEAGKGKSAACQACHGKDGNAKDFPQYPRLAGQHATYLVQALKDYQSGARNNAIMAGLAKPLSETDMRDLAAYFSSLPNGLPDIDVQDMKKK